MNHLTVKMVENLKPADKPYQIREGRGFGLKVMPSGEKRWLFAYTFRGRRRVMSLGRYPDLPLAEAREVHAAARKQLAKDVDPMEYRSKVKLEDRNQVDTWAKAVAAYIYWCEHRPGKRMKKKSLGEERRILTVYPPQSWHQMKIKEIRRRDIKSLLDKISAKAPQMAIQVKKCLHRFINWCVNEEYCENNPCSSLRNSARIVKRSRFLTDSEIKTFWKRIDAAKMRDTTRRALKLALLCGQRIGEICRMRYEDIDNSGRWWTIAGSFTKNDEPQQVYLTNMALEIIGTGSGYVFPSPKKGRGNCHLCPNSPSNALRNNDYLGMPRWIPHDLRRTLATHMPALGVEEKTIEQILNHISFSVTDIYNRYHYNPEKKAALEKWDKKLSALIKS